jgi:hypothetical protein
MLIRQSSDNNNNLLKTNIAAIAELHWMIQIYISTNLHIKLCTDAGIKEFLNLLVEL